MKVRGKKVVLAVAAATLFVLPLRLIIPALAQCLTNLLATDVICAKPRSSDGKKHIVVAPQVGTAEEQALIQSALDAWNAHSGTTGVVFDTPTTAGTSGTADLTFVYTTDSSGTSGTAGCARQDPDTNSIYWGEGARERRATLGDAEFTALFMHEIGHFLGLAHTSDSTIMRGVPGQTCQTPAGATAVTQADAQKVRDCLAANCPRRVVRRSGGGTEPTCGYQETMDPTYNSEGDVTGYEINYVYMCN